MSLIHIAQNEGVKGNWDKYTPSKSFTLGYVCCNQYLEILNIEYLEILKIELKPKMGISLNIYWIFKKRLNIMKYNIHEMSKYGRHIYIEIKNNKMLCLKST